MKSTALLLVSLAVLSLGACGGEDLGTNEGKDKADPLFSLGRGESCSLDLSCDSAQDLVCRPLHDFDELCLSPGEKFEPCLENEDCASDHACLGITVDPDWPILLQAPGVCVANHSTPDDPRWQISVISADIAQILAVDIPDPYVQLIPQKGNATRWETAVIANTYHPRWDAALTQLPESFITIYSWVLAVQDKDGFSDEPLGQCPLTITDEMLQAGSATIPTCGDNVSNLQLSFTRH